MRFIQIGLEDDASKQEVVDLDPNETSKAIEAVENKDSTEPAKVLQVANYKEELAVLRAKNKADEGGETTGDESNNSDDTNADDGNISSGSDDSTGDGLPKTDDKDGKTDVQDTSSEDVEQTPGTTEMGKDAPGKSDTEVAQEDFLVQGHRMALEALDSMQEMSKYLDMIKRRSKLGGISPPTAKIIFNALESHSLRCGYDLDKTKVPSLESYGSYNGADQSTRELSVAIEGFLSSIWDAIKKFFKSIWKWVVDLLSGKKGSTPDSIARPQTEPTRNAAIRDLETKLDVLKKKLDKAEEVQAKLNVKLPKNVAKALFKNKDKGTFKEAFENGETLASVAESFAMLAKFFQQGSQQFSPGVISGKTNGLQIMMATKDNLGSINLGRFEVVPGSNQLLIEYSTEEITNGVHARFTLSGPNKGLYQTTNAHATSLLGKQGLSFVSDKKEQNEISLPDFDKGSLDNLNMIVNEIKKCYNSISDANKFLKSWADFIKKFTEDDIPDTWLGLDNAIITDLKAQVTLIGALELSLSAGYMKLENQVNVYKDGIDKLVTIYSK